MQQEVIIINRTGNEGMLRYEEFFKAIEEFPYECPDAPMEFKIEIMIGLLNDFYKKSKKDLLGVFTLNEAYLIAQIFNGHLYTMGFDDKQILIGNVEDGIEYEGYDAMYDVDKSELLSKLGNLTDAQAFTVIRMAYEFWYCSDKYSTDVDKQIKKVFMIN